MNEEVNKRTAIKKAGWIVDKLRRRFDREYTIEVDDEVGYHGIVITCDDGNFIALNITGEKWSDVRDAVADAYGLLNYMDFEDKRSKRNRG